MRKLKRPKIIKEFLEERLAKNARRIQAISEESYKLRLQLEAINALPVQKPLTKADLEARDKAVAEAEAAAAQPVVEAPKENTDAVR